MPRALLMLVVGALLSGCAEEVAVSRIRELPPQLGRSRIRVVVEPGVQLSPLRASTRCPQLGWPVDAPLSSPFGPRAGRPHDGIDLAAVDGTPVRAACDGVVAYA